MRSFLGKVSAAAAARGADSALERSFSLSSLGIRPVLAHVPGSVGMHSVEKRVGNYLSLLEHPTAREAGISIEVCPIQLGLGIGKGYCLGNLIDILHTTGEAVAVTWMRNVPTHQRDDVLDIVRDSLREYRGLGLELEANLKRSRSDLITILRRGGTTRLVMGKGRGDFSTLEEAEYNFSRLLRILFSKGNRFSLETRDPRMLEEVSALKTRYGKELEIHFHSGARKFLHPSRGGHRLSERILFR